MNGETAFLGGMFTGQLLASRDTLTQERITFVSRPFERQR